MEARLNFGNWHSWAATVVLLLSVGVISAQSRLVFSSGFEDAVQIVENLSQHTTYPWRLSGEDASTGFSWDNLGPTIISMHAYYFCVTSDKLTTDYVDSRIITTIGPSGDSTRALQHWVKKEDPETPARTRNEYCFVYPQENGGFKEVFVRYYMKLPKDPVDFMMMEWKEASPGGGHCNYRNHIMLIKDGNQLGFHVKCQQVHPVRETEWELNNTKIHAPLGKWFLVEAFFRKAATDGRLYLAIDGQVVFDVTRRTEHATNPLPIKYFSPLKIYPDGGQLEPYAEEHGPIIVEYDDFEYWTGFPPETAATPDNNAPVVVTCVPSVRKW